MTVVEAEVVSSDIAPGKSRKGEIAAADDASAGGTDTAGRLHGVSLQGIHPILVPAIPPPDMFKESCHYPLVVTNNPFAGEQSIDGEQSVAKNIEGVNHRVMEFDSEIASGRVDIHIRGAKSTRPGVFSGKKRFVQVALQARFKGRCDASSICIGQELCNDSKIPVWLRSAILNAAAKAFSSSTRVEVEGVPRYFMNPLLAACQLVNVSMAGQEPELWEAQEDIRLLCPGAVDSQGRPLSSERRRKWCDVPSHVAGAALGPDHVITVHFWQHYADFGDYRLSVGLLHLDLSVFMNRFPLQLTVKDVDSGRYAFSALVWHERLLYGAGAAGDTTLEDSVASAERQLMAGGVGSRLLSGVSRILGGS